MSGLPLDLLQDHVWPRVHQLQLRSTVQMIAQIGPSSIEDLPDLLSEFHSWSDTPERPGWSTRVSEARQHAAFFPAADGPARRHG